MQPTTGNILCVEDDADTCAMLACLLGQVGFQATAAECLVDALRLAEAQEFDVFVLDHALPGGSGLDLCRMLRQTHPNTPILFFSGMAYPSDKEAALGAGANDYLIKPNDIVHLPDTLMRLIGESKGKAD